jgi:hypothetical protein
MNMPETASENILVDATLDDPRTRWFVYTVIIVAATANSAAWIANARPLMSANDRSRWCTIWSVAERGPYCIDEIIEKKSRIDDSRRRQSWNTIDKATLDGRSYSTKPPLLPTLIAGAYWCVARTTGWNLLDDTPLVSRILLCIVNLLPMTVYLVVLACIVERYARTNTARFFILVAAASATFLTTFQVTLNNHNVAAASVLFALYPAMRILIDGKRSAGYFMLSGFFAAFACTNELPAALFGVSLFALLLSKSPVRTVAFFVPAALVPLAAFFITNYVATGMIQPIYTLFGTDAYLRNPDGSAGYWDNPQGIDKGGDHPFVYLLHCTFGHHGIFTLSPIFLLTLACWLTIGKWRESPLRPILWLGLFLTTAILCFYLSRTGSYNYGGHTAGLRWTFWLIPFWLIGMIPLLDANANCKGVRTAAAVALLISVFSAAYPLSNPWRHPWLFQLMERWEWIDYSGRTPTGIKTEQLAANQLRLPSKKS